MKNKKKMSAPEKDKVIFKISKQIPRFFLSLTLLSIPFSIRMLFYDQVAYLSGMFSEPTAIFWNVTDILLCLTLVFYLLEQCLSIFACRLPVVRKNIKKSVHNSKPVSLNTCPPWRNEATRGFNLNQGIKSKIFLWAVIFLVFNLLPSLWAQDQTLHFLFSLKILEGIVLMFLLNQKILSSREIGWLLITLAIFEGSLASIQFTLQHSVSLYWLGEPHLTPELAGVAKMDIGGKKVIRAYGTFLHPNILAAFLVIVFFYLDTIRFKKIKYLFLIPLILTFSRGAFVALLAGILVKQISKRRQFKSQFLLSLFVLLMVLGILYYFFPKRFTLDHAFYERLALMKISGMMFIDKIWGVGNAHFILNMQDYVPYFLKPWEFQPVHNLYLLILNENGLLGLSAFLIFLYAVLKSTLKNNQQFLPLFSAILMLGLFDHYFWDLDMGRWLFWVGMGVVVYLIAYHPQA